MLVVPIVCDGFGGFLGGKTVGKRGMESIANFGGGHHMPFDIAKFFNLLVPEAPSPVTIGYDIF